MILRAYKTEIDPTAEQRRRLAQHVAGARVAHNWALERWRTLAGLTRLVSFLRALDGLSETGALEAWTVGAAMRALVHGEKRVTRRPKRTKVAGKTEYTERTRWAVVASAGVVPDRFPSADWIHTQLTAEKHSDGSDVEWLTGLSSFAVREGVGDVGRGYDAFFRRLKKHSAGNHSECKPRRFGGCALGEPRFRRASERSWHADQGSMLRVRRDAILIPGVGWVRLKERGYLPETSPKSHKFLRGGKACGVGISERGGRWYAALRCEVPVLPAAKRAPGPHRERAVPRIPGKVLGVDSGVLFLAVTSDGDRFPGLETDRRLAQLERRRKLWERRMARRWVVGKSRREQSAGWREAAAEVARLHHRIVGVRDDRVGKAVRKIVDSGATTVVVRGPQVATMLARGHGDAARRNVLAPRVHGARMGDLSARLQAKMVWAGGVCIEAPTDYPSTRLCSICGVVRDTDPGYNGWECSGCGAMHDREINAACNLRDYRPPSSESTGSGRTDRDKAGDTPGTTAARTGKCILALRSGLQSDGASSTLGSGNRKVHVAESPEGG